MLLTNSSKMVHLGFFLDEDEEMDIPEPANQKYSLRKPITPYICSTQEDFIEERDFLIQNIFPQIDELCRNRGASFSPKDIRWTTADDSVNNGDLLKVNLDYICKCAPFFMCLLGETYGPYRPVESPPFPRKIPTTPDDIDEAEHWIDRNYFIAASAGYKWILKEAHQNNSIPELEIIQAAFLNDAGHCHFYFRQPEHLDHKYGHLLQDEQECLSVIHKPDSEYADLNIRDLKQRIVKKGLPVKYFQTFEELGNHVLKDWTAIIETLYPPLPFDNKILGSEDYQEWIANENFADSRRQLFINSPEYRTLMSEMTDFANSISEDTVLEEEEQLSIYRSYSVTSSLRKKKQADAKYKSMMILQGDRGCGKSTLIANWLRRYMADYPNVKVIYQYIGSSARSRDLAIFMRRCIEELRTEYLRPDSEIDGPKLLDDDSPWTFHEVAEAFVAAVSLGPCVLVIDGLDEISSSLGISSREIKNFTWLPFPFPSQCHIICTTCRSDLSYYSLAKRSDVKLHAIPLFDDAKLRLTFLEDQMQQYFDHLKKIQGYEKQISDIKLTNRPLFLSMLGTEMQSFAIYTELQQFLDDTYDHCKSFRDFCVRCFNRWTKDHSWQKECLFLESTDDEPELEFEGWVPDVLRLLAVTRTGLSQSDIFALLEHLGYTGRKKIANFNWFQFMSCVGNLIYEKPDGLIQFTHHHIRETVEYILLHTLKPGATDVMMTRTDPEKAWKEQKKKYHSHMAKFFMQQPFSQRVMEELLWQLMMAGDVDALVRVLTDPVVIEKFLDSKKLNPSNKLEIAYYWSLLKNLDVSPAIEYQKLLIKLGMVSTIYPDEKPLHADDRMVDFKDSLLDDLPLSIITGTEGRSTPPLFTPVSIPTIVTPPPTDREQLSVIEESMSTATTESEVDNKVDIKKEMDKRYDSRPVTSSVKGEVIDTIFLTEAKAKHDATETEHEDKDDTKGGNLPYTTKLTWSIIDLLKDLGYDYVTEKILLALNNKLDKSYPLPTEVQLTHAKVQEKLGLYDTDKQRAEKWFRKSLRTVTNLSDIEEDDPCYMDVQNLKGHLLCSFGYIRLNEDLFDTADDLLQEGLDCAQECGNITLRAKILFNIGLLRTRQEDFYLAETSFKQALSMRELWYGKSHPFVSEVLFALARIMGNPRNRKGFNNLTAESLYRRTMKIQEECKGKDDISVADTLFELGKLLQDETSFQAKSEAVRLLRRALDIKTSKLGGDHIDTRAVRQYLSNLEVTIKMGRYEFGPAKPTDTRSQDRPYSGLSWREKDLKNFERKAKRAYLQSEANSRPTSKEDYRSLSRGSNLTFLSASEKILMESERPRLLHRESIERRLQQTSTPKSIPDTGLSDTTDSKKQVMLEIRVDGHGEEEEAEDTLGEMRVVEPQIDSFGVELTPAGGTSIIGSSQPNRSSPEANGLDEKGPSRLFKRFGSAGSERSSVCSKHGETTKQDKSSVCSKHGDAKIKRNRSLHSAHSGCSYVTGVSSVSKTSLKSHQSSCDLPGPHSIHISNTRSVTSGPNCSLTSLLGAPETPRNISKGIHHTSAWYHVPGRYTTPDKKVPPKRSQKTPEAMSLQRRYGYEPKTYGKAKSFSMKYGYGRVSYKKAVREEQNANESEANFGPLVKGYQLPINGYSNYDYAQHEGEFDSVLDPGHHSTTVKFKEAVIVD